MTLIVLLGTKVFFLFPEYVIIIEDVLKEIVLTRSMGGQPHVRGHIWERAHAAAEPAQVKWKGLSKRREAILAQSDRQINALKGRAKG